MLKEFKQGDILIFLSKNIQIGIKMEKVITIIMVIIVGKVIKNLIDLLLDIPMVLSIIYI